MTAHRSWRRVLATATAGLIVASGAALVPVAANAAPADGEVTGATLSWGVRDSFRSYITSPIAGGKATLLGTTTGTGPFTWTGGTGTANLDGSDVDVTFGDSDGVHFQGHAHGEDYILDLAFTQPHIKVTSPTTAELYVDVDGREFVDTTTVGESYTLDDVHFADVTLPDPTVAGSSYTWTNAAATMTAEGLDAFGGFYAAGNAGLDPITFTAPVSAVPAEVATETTTTIAANAAAATEGDDVKFTATVAPASAAGTVTFTNETASGSAEIADAVAVENGVATLTTDGLPVGENAVSAKFVPADTDAFTASTSSSTTVTVAERKVWEPKLQVFLSDGVTPVGDTRVSAGDELVVKGSGFDPQANVGGRGVPIPNTLPQGTYVVFGEFGANWQPSTGAASTQRLVASQGWVLTEDTVNQIPAAFQGTVRGQWVSLDADGAFEWTVTLKDRDAAKPATTDGSYGVFTYGAGGVNNAAQEQEERLNYGAPLVATTTTLAASAESAQQGDEVTLTATVSPADQAGTVQFSDGSTKLGEPVAVANGVATLTTTDLPVGSHDLSAVFTPTDEENVLDSTAQAVTVTITAAPVLPVITIDGDKPAQANVRQGETSTFTAGRFEAGNEFDVTVRPVAPETRAESAVARADGAAVTQIGTAVANESGSAEIEWAVPVDFAPGDYIVSFAGTNVEQNVEAGFAVSQFARSTTSLTSSAGVGGGPDGVEFVATISPETATGSVTFTNNGETIATVPVENGVARATTDLAVGDNEIVAAFASNDETVSDSVSDSLIITVTGGGSAEGGANGATEGGGTGGGTIGTVVTAPTSGNVAAANGLATTGGESIAGLLAGGVLALMLGAGLIVARRRVAAN